MEIKKENLLNALNTGSENVKETILALFPELKEETAQKAANRPITERVKTFEDALNILGEENQFVKEFRGMITYAAEENCFPSWDMQAFLKLRIICAALNEGWQPEFSEDEWRYYPYFFLYTDEELSEKSDEWKNDRRLISTGSYEVKGYAGLAYALSYYVPSHTSAYFGSRLCLKSDTLASYCGKQFIELWADFYLIRRDEE